jgi:hypothetical protein
MGRLFDLRSYGWAFTLATLLPIIGYAIWRVLDGTPPRLRAAAGESVIRRGAVQRQVRK